jgi:hypothetical protein
MHIHRKFWYKAKTETMMVTSPIPTFSIVTKSNGVCNPPLVHVATVIFAMASSTDRLIPLSSMAFVAL